MNNDEFFLNVPVSNTSPDDKEANAPWKSKLRLKRSGARNFEENKEDADLLTSVNKLL